jgi:site-specific recombinase XerD
MTIHFERRADRPDSEGLCAIHLRVIFDGQRLRVASGERCTAADWNTKAKWFRRSFGDLDNATERLNNLRSLIEKCYSTLRTKHGTVTAAQLKAAVAAVGQEPAADSPGFLALFTEFRDGLLGRGFQLSTVKSYTSTLNGLAEWAEGRRGTLALAGFDMAAYEELLGWLRSVRALEKNSVAAFVKRLKSFLVWAQENRGLALGLEVKKLKVEWQEVDKCWLSAAELDLVARAMLPEQLGRVRDAFVFCCYTGLRYSDLADLHAGNLHTWNDSTILRLTQTKTRTGVSIYLTPPALALLAKYDGTRVRLLPVLANQVMNRYLKRIARLAGVVVPMELVESVGGRVLKKQVEKWELVTMHTARHTFATQSLLRGMPVEVLQKVLGHAKIQTTMLYAKVVEDLQHQTMRRIWEGVASADTGAADGAAGAVCEVQPAA